MMLKIYKVLRLWREVVWSHTVQHEHDTQQHLALSLILCLLCCNAEMKYLEEVVSVRALLPTQAVMDGLDWGHAKLRTNQVVASPPYMRFNRNPSQSGQL